MKNQKAFDLKVKNDKTTEDKRVANGVDFNIPC